LYFTNGRAGSQAGKTSNTTAVNAAPGAKESSMQALKIIAAAGLFGVEATRDRALVVLQQVPWEVTTSYGSGTSLGPKAILKASPQIDLFDIEFGEAYRAGFYLEPADEKIEEMNLSLKPIAQRIIAEYEEKGEIGDDSSSQLQHVNQGSQVMVERVYTSAVKILEEGKIPGLI